MNRHRPPTEHFEKMRPILKKEYPDKSPDEIDEIAAGIWHHRYTPKTIKKLKKKYEGFTELGDRLAKVAEELADGKFRSFDDADPKAAKQKEKKARNRVNDALADLTKNHYFQSTPAKEIGEILNANGFKGSVMFGIYTGRDGKIHEQCGPNTWIFMTWHKMENSGKYEIVTYVS